MNKQKGTAGMSCVSPLTKKRFDLSAALGGRKWAAAATAAATAAAVTHQQRHQQQNILIPRSSEFCAARQVFLVKC